MSRLIALSLIALLSACVTSRADDKISFDEAFGPAPEEPEAAPMQVQAPRARVRNRTRDLKAPGKDLPTASTSPELQAALAAFVNKAREYRRQVKRGSPMPGEQEENWVQVTGALDTFLLRPAEKTSAMDIVRARVTLEAELEEDARSYGDIPEELAESVMTRVSELVARMADVRRLMVKTVDAPPRFTWPISPVSVTSGFGERAHPILGEMKEHLGVDLAARRGQAVVAAAPGVVLNAGWNGGYGYQVEIQHAARITTRYSHLARVMVEPGQILERGDLVGLAGDTGMATGVHLHFEVWKDGRARDPLDELDRGDAVEIGTVSLEAAPPSEKRQGRRPVGRRP
ncbi:M23 family metallopeptidase [Hyalangium versicolor]|uniref:M23 family metallopeptidase n=1 Tax=Hyalangium versicolor TaxID=2861190 RepID=UPI001CCAE312|nr:M23 family metallopeptidase [Hyalangium versicolor]